MTGTGHLSLEKVLTDGGIRREYGLLSVWGAAIHWLYGKSRLPSSVTTPLCYGRRPDLSDMRPHAAQCISERLQGLGFLGPSGAQRDHL